MSRERAIGTDKVVDWPAAEVYKERDGLQGRRVVGTKPKSDSAAVEQLQ